MKTKIKICGIRTFEEALFCLNGGVDYLGFNFVLDSPRYIAPGKAKNIIEKLPKRYAETVGVFRDEAVEKVSEIMKVTLIDLIQLHGNEDENYCISLPNTRIIKVFTLADAKKSHLKKFPAEFFLIDREVRGKGKTVDFNEAAKISENYNLFLAGGITPDNVRQAVSEVKPFAVDVAGGVETNGKKDFLKIKKFINQVGMPL